MKLQQAYYLKKNNPGQYAQSTGSSQRPEAVLNRRSHNKFSALFRSPQEDFQGQDPAKSSEEGIACLTHTWFTESAIRISVRQ
jgi:hypothetical protein